MAILLLAILAFAVMRVGVPRLKAASNARLAALAATCAIGGWLLLSAVANLAFHAG